jgi:copper chaperone CopZ
MRTHYLTVTGMMSGACRTKVAEALSMLHGVGHVRVSPTHGSVTIHCNEHHISLGEISAAIEEAGFGIDSAGPVHTHHEAVRLIATSPESHYK